MNEQAIFLAALEIADPIQRADFLNKSCAGKPELRQQVAALLTAHARSGEFLDVPALQQLAAAVPAVPHEETHAEPGAVPGEITLSFLQSSTRPGSLGRLGHYDVREVIGRGGCGIVLKAFDEMLQRAVAVKVMAPELAATSPARKRFLREARATAAIRHENVVSIHAVEDQPLPYLVMEYIAGQTLQQKLDQSGPLELLEVVRIGRQIASGLAAAHAQGLIHRDIKPGNILLEGGHDCVKITDFGLARSADDASLTQSGVIAGTPLYMSPEQARGEIIDQRSDLFSLGSVLYVLCSGRPPFRAATMLAVLKRVAEDQPRPLQEIIPEIPDWLSDLIARLHAKNSNDRFASAQEVAGLLARQVTKLQEHEGAETSGDSESPLPKPAQTPAISVGETPRQSAVQSRHGRRWRAVAAVLVLLLVGLGVTESSGVTTLRSTLMHLFSAEGTLVVEVDDPDISVTIDGEELTITGAGAKEMRLKPGRYKVQARREGNLVYEEVVTVKKHSRQVVHVR